MWLGIAISGFFLYQLAQKIDPAELSRAFSEMDYRYLLPALLLTFVSYFFRALRWKYLLLPIKRARIPHLFSSTLIGYMANNLLPARLGEFVRAYSLARQEGLETSSVFGTLVVDRLWDAFSMLLVLVATIFLVQLPEGKEAVQHRLVEGGYFTVGAFAAMFSVFLLLCRKPDLLPKVVGALPLPAKLKDRLVRLAGSFMGGLRLWESPRQLGALFLMSALVWATAIWPLDMILASFNLHFPIPVSMFIMVFLVVAVMVPASPGFVGTYHFACFKALEAFNVTGGRAVSIAIVMHAMGFLPVTVAGLYCLWHSKLTLKKVTEAEQAEHETGAPA